MKQALIAAALLLAPLAASAQPAPSVPSSSAFAGALATNLANALAELDTTKASNAALQQKVDDLTKQLAAAKTTPPSPPAQ